MKIPVSKLNSKELEVLFEESKYIEKTFFPRKVPKPPCFEEAEGALVFKKESWIEDE